jgi:hypothetical protein
VLFAACVGFVVPLVLLFLARLTHSAPLVDRAMIVWPTCAFLTATEGHEHTLHGYLVLAAVIAANVVLYIVAFTFLWCIGWFIRAWRRSLHDGTTI